MTTYAYVTPASLRWARESSGFDVVEAARRIGVSWIELEAAEGGDDLLTLRQAEKAAEVYQRFLAELYLPEPPEEESQEAQFRRLPGAPAPPWPPQMQMLVRRVRERQDEAAELYDALDESPPWHEARRGLQAAPDPAEAARLARQWVGVSIEQQLHPSDAYASQRLWVDAVERLGVLVMQDGSMGLDAMRGFVSEHPDVPAIVVNTKDDPRARAFTVGHELGHLVARLSGGPAQSIETWCNDFAGHLLMPDEWLRAEFSATEGRALASRARGFARALGVTPLAAATRVARSGLVGASEGRALVKATRGRQQEDEDESGGGGNYYRNQIANLGPSYIGLVLESVEAGAITYPTATRLLGGVRSNNFATLREYLSTRESG